MGPKVAACIGVGVCVRYYTQYVQQEAMGSHGLSDYSKLLQQQEIL